MLKNMLLIIALVISIDISIASSNGGNNVIEKENTYGAASVNYMGVPLNINGAVSSSATVPLNVQVPKNPDSAKLTEIIPATKIWKNQVVVPPTLNVTSYLLMDAKTGNIIASKDGNLRVAPASLTKMMLLYIASKNLASGNLNFDQKFTVPAIAWHTAGSSMHLKAGQEVTIKDLFEGTIIASGNDAAVSLAIAIAGTQEGFVDIMNFTAKKLGMTNTHFTNVMGLPAPNLFTSAYDLAILSHHLIYDYPQYYLYYKMKSVSMNGFKTYNYNKLLDIYKYADGIKTGSTDSAGYSLVASAIKPNRNRLISVIIGSTSLMQSARDSQNLLEYGFNNFTTKIFYPQDYVLGNMRVYKGEHDNTNIGTKEQISISFPKDVNPEEIKFVLHKNSNGLTAPVRIGDLAGKIMVIYKTDKNIIKEFDLVALEENKAGSFWKKIKDSVLLWISKIFN